MYIQNHIVVDGQPQHNAHQRELCIVLKAVRVEPEGASLRVEAEHGWGGDTVLTRVIV